MRCSLMPFSRRIAATSRWLESSSPTAPSISSSVPSRMLASGVLSSCDMWRRKRLRSCASSSRRCRSHSSCPPRRSRSCGPETAIGLVKVPSPSSLMARSSWRSGRPTPTVRTSTARSASGSSSAACHSRRLRACSVRSSSTATSVSTCALLCCATRCDERRELREALRQLARGGGILGRGRLHDGLADGLLQLPELLERVARLARRLAVQLFARAAQQRVLGAVQLEQLRVIEHVVEARRALERGDLPEQRLARRAQSVTPWITIFWPVSARSRICSTAVSTATSSGTAIRPGRPASVHSMTWDAPTAWGRILPGVHAARIGLARLAMPLTRARCWSRCSQA